MEGFRGGLNRQLPFVATKATHPSPCLALPIPMGPSWAPPGPQRAPKQSGELYAAREALRSVGGRPSENLFQVEQGSWSSYLQEIGLPRATAHRWLERYDPESDTLYERPVE